MSKNTSKEDDYILSSDNEFLREEVETWSEEYLENFASKITAEDSAFKLLTSVGKDRPAKARQIFQALPARTKRILIGDNRTMTEILEVVPDLYPLLGEAEQRNKAYQKAVIDNFDTISEKTRRKIEKTAGDFRNTKEFALTVSKGGYYLFGLASKAMRSDRDVVNEFLEEYVGYPDDTNAFVALLSLISNVEEGAVTQKLVKTIRSAVDQGFLDRVSSLRMDGPKDSLNWDALLHIFKEVPALLDMRLLKRLSDSLFEDFNDSIQTEKRRKTREFVQKIKRLYYNKTQDEDERQKFSRDLEDHIMEIRNEKNAVGIRQHAATGIYSDPRQASVYSSQSTTRCAHCHRAHWHVRE